MQTMNKLSSLATGLDKIDTNTMELIYNLIKARCELVFPLSFFAILGALSTSPLYLG